MKNLIMARDINGYNNFGTIFSLDLFNGILVSGVEQTLTVPVTTNPEYKRVLAIFYFQPGASVWVAINQTATVPSGSISSSTSCGNPTAKWVDGNEVLHFITNDESDEFGVEFFSF